MSKPNGWYSMSQDERRAWEKSNRECEDAEYEASRAKEDAERAERDARSARDDMRRAREAHNEDREMLVNEIDGLEETVSEVRAQRDKLLEVCQLHLALVDELRTLNIKDEKVFAEWRARNEAAFDQMREAAKEVEENKA